MSYNSIRGWWTINRLLETDNKRVHDCARFQIQLADGVAIDRMIPHFSAAPIQRRWVLPYFGWEAPSACTSYLFYLLRYMMNFALSYTPLKHWIRLHFVSINICLMNPKSVGRVSLVPRTKNDRETNDGSSLSCYEVVVDPGYLSDPRDLDALWKGWEATDVWKLMQSGECIEMLPGYCYTILFNIVRLVSLVFSWLWFLLSARSANRKDDHGAGMSPLSWFSSYTAEFANPYYHWFGTCAMGHNHHKDVTGIECIEECSFVVDGCLSVRGVSGLRVCDASIFPDCVTVPTALTCAALGCAASELILPR
jgi:choline dehydrogenase-like flavoprotein